jgi:hypothetical protein
MTCSQCKYLTVEQIKNMNTEQLIGAYRQGYILKDIKSDIKPLASSCLSSISAGQTININAAPMEGMAPYTVSFYKKLNTSDPVIIGTTQTGILEATNSMTPSTIAQPYTITYADIAVATGDSITFPILMPGYIRIIVNITDSCPIASGGPKTCSELCDINITCMEPICNIIIEPA